MGIVAFISGKRYKLRITLPPPLGCEKVIIPAARAVGIASADPRTRVIDCALAFLGVKKLTDFPEDVILLMSKNSAHGRSFCVSPLCLLVGNTKVIRDS
jgi:hypothetical protein